VEQAAHHPAVQRVIEQFDALALHAARSGREVMDALTQVALDSKAVNLAELSGEVEAAVDVLLAAMPAYAPPLNVMHRLLSRLEEAQNTGAAADDLRQAFEREAAAFHEWSSSARERIAAYGAEIIPDGATVFTYTLSETALRTLREVARRGKRFKVLVTESRPNNDGLVTAKELSKEGVEVAVSIDACIAELIPQADLMMVGAEAVMPDGSAVCKVGTYPSALVAKSCGAPVYVTVDTLKFNVTAVAGLSLKVDPIRRSDMTADGSATVVGHLFDRTPPELLRGVVTERGVLSPQACAAVMAGMPMSQRLIDKLKVWSLPDAVVTRIT
jgi:translation initiation factor 2B subunit (eIF-2B alpha/beta/delta family)